MMQTLVFDNGAYSIKAGYTTDTLPRICPNAVFKSRSDRKRVYISDELEECLDRSSLFFVLPFERGYLVNWDTQLQIWNHLFGQDRLNVDFKNTRLVLTDPSDIARAFTDNTEEIIFENFCFHSLLRTSAPSLVAQAHCSTENPCCIVVDSGHSFTHIVPYVQGQIVHEGVIRVDVGGKALTNQLKDWISYRQLNVMDETYVINCCKEDACFVSTNFQKDLENWRERRAEYILPDFVKLMRGEVREKGSMGAGMAKGHCPQGGQSLPSQSSSSHSLRPTDDTQKLLLGVERFALPELLFNPSDVEVAQMGLVEAVHTSLSRLPEEMQLLMARNIILTGGNSLFPGYRERIEHDLRTLLDDRFQLRSILPPDPIAHAWDCGRKLLSVDVRQQLNGSQFARRFVSRAEYEEQGTGICRRRFANYWQTKEGEEVEDSRGGTSSTVGRQLSSLRVTS